MNAPTNIKTPTILDLDSLLDMEMDSVETLPDYVTPAAGTYMLRVVEAGIKEGKAVGDKPAMHRVQIVYAIDETVECSDGQPFPNGSLFADRYSATEDGVAYFKKQAMKVLNVTDMSGAKMRDIFETLQGASFKAAVTQKITKSADGKDYVNVNVRPLHEAPAN